MTPKWDANLWNEHACNSWSKLKHNEVNQVPQAGKDAPPRGKFCYTKKLAFALAKSATIKEWTWPKRRSNRLYA